MSDEVFDFLRNLVLGFTGVLGKPVCPCSDSDSIRVNKRMNEVTESVKHTSSHPHISFVIDHILSIGINNLRRSVHRCGHAFDILFNGVIVFFTDLSKIVNLFSA